MTEISDWDEWDEGQLSKIALVNAIVHNKEKAELEIKSMKKMESHKRIAEEMEMQNRQLTQKYLEIQNLHMREMMRPCKLNHAVVGYNAPEKNYACAFTEADGLYDPIVAYGDTPSEACDNFDLIWMGLSNDE
jgi:hypothetical protein